MWNMGCQLVALNYQTSDKAMMLNDAMFRANGGTGYILKPEFMRTSTNRTSFSANILSRKPVIIDIMVISGQHIPKPGQSSEGEVVDPYVLVKIRGHPFDKQKLRTRYIHNNGFNPVWNESVSLRVQVPDLAMLYFKVKDNNSRGKDVRLGEYMLPLSSVQQGYRHVYLVDRGGNPLVPASLFVHIKISEQET
jgi:phosphatidylinositol phospholipase C delta